MRLWPLLIISAGLVESMVNFANSALYDIYDFKGVKEVSIPKCDNGCLIFAATKGEGFIQEPDGLEPYSNNLYIYDESGAKDSIAKIATQRDANQRKIPLTLDGQRKVTVKNLNEPDHEKLVTQSIVLYVVKKTEAAQFSYEVIDTYYSQGTIITPSSDIITILSADFFGVQAAATTDANSATVRLVGFDNALDNNTDGCPYAYKTPESPSFPGFSLRTTTSILSIVVGKYSALKLQTQTQFPDTYRDISLDGFITSPGWNGCSNGGFQSFRTPDDSPSDSYILTNNDDFFQVNVTVLPNFDEKHSLTITNMKSFGDSKTVTGTSQQQFRFDKTNYILCEFDNMKGDQGFLLRYSSALIPKITTAGPISSTTTSAPTTTSSEQPATTSGALEITGMISPMLLFWAFI
ncbi:hypothetical protein PRIPAC_91443 [Pristionchus pacificus]|uniref:Uncharacterized protein n=1 Tax=Pristionchus pacificus TaxID=54126 RepID=A0A2A6CVA6_PRIPA|nr:hypothetical protein PRIPAC_91443 [Pristionchus pacificus]|eukprot:PDM82016.1 hypothetical protein PRIPAC_36409 [Pristionchus pacificus]